MLHRRADRRGRTWIGVAAMVLCIRGAAAAGSAPEGSAPERIGTELGFAVFQQHCVSCHGNPAYDRAPQPATLRSMTPERIYAALTTGIMKTVGDTLTEVDRRRVAESLAGQFLGSQAGDAAAMPNHCAANPPLHDLPAHDWNGWGNDLANSRFQGTAAAFQGSLANEGLLILAALAAVYIVLGVLYESFIHPITILSTLPSAGVGALLALILFKQVMNVVAIIGIILLIGIVKKNGIMMVDFALEGERERGMNSTDAIYEACLLRFRPIMMTTMAALLAGIPLAMGTGMGSELRRPLGIAMVGGLLLSQILTLYTTPVIYIFFDRFGHGVKRVQAAIKNGGETQPAESA